MPRALRSRLPSMVAVAACTAMLGGGDARAQDAKEEAARSFQAGSAAYARGELRAAAHAFDEAYRLVPRGAAAYNGGLSWQSVGDRRRAADDYTRALETSDLGAAERADATGRLRGLESSLARLSLSSPPRSRLVLDDAELPGSTASVHLEPGAHVLRVRYPGGKTEARTLTLGAGAEQSIELSEPREEPPPARPDPVDVPPFSHAGSTARPPADHTAAWLVLGGAVVTGIVAVVAFEEGVAARNSFDQTGDKDPSLRDQATNLRTLTWVSWAVAGGLAVTGVVLYLNAPAGTPPPPASAGTSVVLGGHGVSLRVTF